MLSVGCVRGFLSPRKGPVVVDLLANSGSPPNHPRLVKGWSIIPVVTGEHGRIRQQGCISGDPVIPYPRGFQRIGVEPDVALVSSPEQIDGMATRSHNRDQARNRLPRVRRKTPPVFLSRKPMMTY